MKFLVLIGYAMVFLSSFGMSDLQTFRHNYGKVVSDKMLCEEMLKDLEKEKNNSPIYLGYLGAYQTIWANHVFNPLEKLNTFRKGKKNIEHAINQQPKNVELRFIRFSVQKKAPSFLGYRSHIKEDEDFIRKNRDAISSEIVNKNIDALLKD